ncbi:MAG: amidohydrolase family protein [Saprospiraceae bacterium]|nr:amidohydrolase family protein [Saprospiraceae bacterium]MDW8228766.1 amidohydrolase family protein [Saprospiraceae bacterium]
MRNLIFTTLLFSLGYTAFGQPPTPAPPQRGSVLILGATAHLGNGQAIANSAIAFEDGRITLVADATTTRIDPSKYRRIFDAKGKHVYPGFIAMNSRLGLVEVDAVRATQDFSEIGEYNPNARSIIAYNTDSDITPTVRSNGVLAAQVVPTGGVLSGTSSVVQLDAWNWEDAALRMEDGLHLNWPAPRARRTPAFGPMPAEEQPEDAYDKRVKEIREFFQEAKAYCQNPSPEVRNPRFEAMRGVLEGKQNLYIHTNHARSMQEAILFAEQMKVRPVLVGAADSWLITDFLREHQVTVVLTQTHRLPSRQDEDIDQPYKTPALLHAAGIPFAVASEGAWQQRNLPFEAGQAVGYGLPYEAAIQAITLTPAVILGVAGRIGSLEVGKDATLFISEGDALDMRTHQVTAAFIQGREINLDNKHKQLYRRFEERYRQR